jgi:hypothetical protein
MTPETVLSLAALVVALVALLNTLFQVLQQYYATADGYQRCSPSVMGEWAKFTRRKFIWKEFRFETHFGSPVIFLDVAYELKAAAESSALVVLDGTSEMDEWPGLKTEKADNHHPFPRWSVFGHYHHWIYPRPKEAARERPIRTLSSAGIRDFLRTNTPLISPETRMEQFLKLDRDPTGQQPENMPVTWIPFMQSLQQYSSSLRLCGLSVLQDSASGSLIRGRVLAPGIRVSKKSWDFMPADIIKPLALSNVRDVATMVQYLGCRWTSFKPEEFILRAEGDGIMVTSVEVKSLGAVISFVKTDSRSDDRRRLHGVVFSPLEGAATLGFGTISSDLLGGESYKVFDLESCEQTINHLTISSADPQGLPTIVMETRESYWDEIVSTHANTYSYNRHLGTPDPCLSPCQYRSYLPGAAVTIRQRRRCFPEELVGVLCNRTSGFNRLKPVTFSQQTREGSTGTARSSRAFCRSPKMEA